MDLSATPPVNATAPNTATTGVPPRLGTPVPGTTGGLPALGGLSVNNNPMASQLQSMNGTQNTSTTPNQAQPAQNTFGSQGLYPSQPQPQLPDPNSNPTPQGVQGMLLPTNVQPEGGSTEPQYQYARGGTTQVANDVRSRGRGGDTMLVHMTPNELNSLQGLARAHGGSLTINPQTGLPEDGFLSKILPMAIGALGTVATGGALSPLLLAGLTGAGTAAITGDINKGLLAGLGAFGGAGLATALGGGAAAAAAPELVGSTALEQAGLTAAEQATATTAATAAEQVAAQAVPGVAAQAAPNALTMGANYAPEAISQGIGNLGAVAAPTTVAAPTAAPGFLSRFGAATSIEGAPKMVNTVLPYAAAYGALAPALTPTYEDMPEEDIDYTIPQYRRRSLMPRIPEGDAYNRDNYRGEYQFFDFPGFQRMAEGDEVAAPAAGGLGSAKPSLSDYVSMFQTSPGAITGVPYGYGPGQSPMDLIRAQIAAMPAPTATPDTPAANAAPMGGMAPAFGAENDYGFMKNTTSRRPMGFYDDAYGGFSGGYGGYPAGGFDYARMMDGYAKGGAIEMESGGFVMPARETAEFGNGSTEAGQRHLASMGGMPINGRGDGVSDSIVARIDGTQQARLANGETYFPPSAVQQMGGADKLRAMMNKATQSHKQAARGGGNQLRGLA